MSLHPTVDVLPRRGEGTSPPGGSDAPAADWSRVEAELREGGATCWLAVVRADATPHVRPVFAAWSGQAFVVTSNPTAAKTRHLRANPACTVTAALARLHLVVEGEAREVSDVGGLGRASAAMSEVYDWPTEATDDGLLDAPYAAPTSGGPPFAVFEIRPTLAYAFPTDDAVEPTRWRF